MKHAAAPLPSHRSAFVGVGASAQPVPFVVGGVDVYRSATLTREQVMREHGAVPDSLATAFVRADFAAARPHYQKVVESVRDRGDVAYLDIGVTTSNEGATRSTS